MAAVKGPGVVTGRYGTLGQAFLIKEDFWPLNTTLYVEDFQGNDPAFVCYLLKTLALEQRNDKSSVPGLNRNDLHRIEVAHPPLLSQRAIARVLGALDDKIDLNRRINITSQALADAFYNTGKLGNKLVPFLSGCEVRTGGTPKTDTTEYWDGEIPWVAIKDLEQAPFILKTAKTITTFGVASSAAKILPNHTVVISARGTVGLASMTAGPMAINQSCYALVSRTPLTIYHRARQAVEDLRSRAHGSIFDTITRSTLEGLRVPAMDDEGSFERTVAPLYDLMLANQRENQTLAALRDVLLPELIAGRMKVKEAEDATQE